MSRYLRLLKAPATALAVGALLAACDGQNCFTAPTGSPCNGPIGGDSTVTGVADSIAPEVQIELPLDSAVVAAGDSVFVRVHLSDNHRLASLTLEGFALRGDPALGTEIRVDRFVTKTIDLLSAGRVVDDTTLVRYLNATADSTPERRIRIVATARDSAGETAVDTAFIHIGGPRIQIVTPTAGQAVPAGTQISVRLVAELPAPAA